MPRVLALTLTIAAFVIPAGGPARAAAPPPVCRAATVLDEIAREVQVRNHYASVDPRLVTEQATALPNLVHCQVCILETPYEMTRFDEHPVRRCVAGAFEVRIVPNGYVVRDLR